MKSLYISVMAFVLSMIPFSVMEAQEEEAPVERKLVCTYTLGEILDEGTSEGKITKKVVNYFDADGMLQRTCTYVTGTTNGFTLSDVVKYAYEQRNDTLVRTASAFQWGKFDFGDMGFKSATSSSSGTVYYDVNGNMLRNATSTYTYDYKYDQEGRLTEMSKSNSYSGAVSEISAYTYDGEGLLQEVVTTDANGKFKLKTKYEYDANGNLQYATQYKRPTSSITNPSSEYAYIVEEYTYTDNVLTEYIKYSNGTATAAPRESSRKTYEFYNGNPNMTLITSYSWTSSKEAWTKSGLPIVEEYADFSTDIAELASIDLSAVYAGGAVCLEFTVPFLSQMAAYSRFNVYRDGHLIKEFSLADCISNDSIEAVEKEVRLHGDTIVYADSAASNGIHEYFVLPLFGIAPDLAEDSDIVWTSSCISSIAVADADYALSPVTSLHIASARSESYVQEGVNMKSRYVVIAWENPEITEEQGFIKHELYFWNVIAGKDYFVYKEETSDLETLCLETSFDPTRDSMNFVVVSHYKYGNVISEMLTVKSDELNNLITSISALEVSGDKVSQGAVYDLHGRMYADPKALGKGIYVVGGKKVVIR